MTEIEKVKSEIKVLEAKLSFLEELERTKTPCEEAFKRVYNRYPATDVNDTCWDGSTWIDFKFGYNAAQEDYKVGEYQEKPEEEQGTWNYDPDAKFRKLEEVKELEESEMKLVDDGVVHIVSYEDIQYFRVETPISVVWFRQYQNRKCPMNSPLLIMVTDPEIEKNLVEQYRIYISNNKQDNKVSAKNWKTKIGKM